MRNKEQTKQVCFKMYRDDYDAFRKILQDEGHQLSSFVRMAVSNELKRIKNYNKEKTQTWDLE